MDYLFKRCKTKPLNATKDVSQKTLHGTVAWRAGTL